MLKGAGTGRSWGDKLPPTKTKIKIEGNTLYINAQDVWEGPLEPGEKGEYHRFFTLSDK